MYQATAPARRPLRRGDSAAFQTAMKTVLIRVTGRRNADEDPALAPLVSNARRYVQQYRAAPDDQVWVAFDGPAIERWLTQNGQPLWGHERPTTLVLLGGANRRAKRQRRDHRRYLRAQNGDRCRGYGARFAADVAQRRRTAEIPYRLRGGERGLAVHFGGNWAAHGQRRGAHRTRERRERECQCALDAFVSGSKQRILRHLGRRESRRRFVRRLFAASGELVPVDIEVSGLNDLRDYASLESYLESLTFISHVSVESLSGDTVRFRLATRGGVDSLQRALSLNGRLQPVAAGENGIQRFQLHH